MSKSVLLKTAPAIRPQYDEHGATEYYRTHGATYRNPHEPVIRSLIETAVKESNFDPAAAQVVDLACGSGEATLALRALAFANIDGIDPYTGAAYLDRTGRRAAAFSFEDVASGVLALSHYDLCVCSFALHLALPSLLPQLALQLALSCRVLWLLTPHKRPHLKDDWGWQFNKEIMMSRVRLRIYDSSLRI